MIPPSYRLRVGFCAVGLCISASATAQTRSLYGVVRMADATAAKRTEVQVTGGGSAITSESSEFSLSLARQSQTGFPLKFSVKGYVVVDPFHFGYGRLPLSVSQATTVSLTVLRLGDRRLLGPPHISRILEAQASLFVPKVPQLAAEFLQGQATALGFTAQEVAAALETQRLMTLFYENWFSGKDKREALHQAQQDLRKELEARWGEAPPYYWAAFVLVGR